MRTRVLFEAKFIHRLKTFNFHRFKLDHERLIHYSKEPLHCFFRPRKSVLLSEVLSINERTGANN